MKKLIILFTALAFLPSTFAQNPDDYRGGWKTEVNGVPRTYEFSIRGETVRGIYCTWCADATTLAFVDGKFGRDGLSFTVTHADNNGKTTFTDKGTAKFEKPGLVVTGTLAGPGGGNFKWTMIKDDRGPTRSPSPSSCCRPAAKSPSLAAAAVQVRQRQRRTGAAQRKAAAPRAPASGGGEPAMSHRALG